MTTYWAQTVLNRKITISRSRTLFGPQNSILDRFCHTGSRFASQRPNPTISPSPVIKDRSTVDSCIRIGFRDQKSPHVKSKISDRVKESKTAREDSFLRSSTGPKFLSDVRCPISTIFDQFLHWLIILLRFKSGFNVNWDYTWESC